LWLMFSSDLDGGKDQVEGKWVRTCLEPTKSRIVHDYGKNRMAANGIVMNDESMLFYCFCFCPLLRNQWAPRNTRNKEQGPALLQEQQSRATKPTKKILIVSFQLGLLRSLKTAMCTKLASYQLSMSPEGIHAYLQ